MATTDGLGGPPLAGGAGALDEVNGPVGGIDGWNVVSSSRSLSYTTIVPFACETRKRFRLPGTQRMAVHGELVMHPCLFNRTYRVERGSKECVRSSKLALCGAAARGDCSTEPKKVSRVEAYNDIYASG